MTWIEYNKLPDSAGGFSDLFNDFIYNFEAVKRFFPFDFRLSSSYEQAMKQVAKSQRERNQLADILKRQNEHFGCEAETFGKIELLKKPSTFAIVTGQQVGLLGGPLYTLFKTLTTIKLAQKLKKQYPQSDFVPVFWVEGEDHDFEEMNHVYIVNTQNQSQRIEYLIGGEKNEKNVGPVGELVFDPNIQSVHKELASSMPSSEYTQDILKPLATHYAEGKSFNQAFVGWMNHLFSGYGLIFLSGNDPDLKRLASPLFVKEIEEFPRTSQLVIDQSAELEKKYHAQVKPKSINLFMFHKGGRYAINPREEDFSLKGTRHFMSRDELLRIAHETPELLSPNVVLRPIVQDTLLPTLVYVGGPSEIAYNAQLTPVYRMFGVQQPIVYPRASASFITERTIKTLEKYDVTISDFFESTAEQLTASVLEQVADVKLDSLFGEAATQFKHAIDELEFGLREVDKTLLGPLVSVEKKMEQSLEVLKGKAIEAQKRGNEVVVNQIEKASSALLPHGELQERSLSPLYFMNRYGSELVRWLDGELDIAGFKHQIFKM
ncbi:MAG TPA: bacillithiol biosynthesis cysteine-adding enzyme BshC [Bacteroidota bacterium]